MAQFRIVERVGADDPRAFVRLEKILRQVRPRHQMKTVNLHNGPSRSPKATDMAESAPALLLAATVSIPSFSALLRLLRPCSDRKLVGFSVSRCRYRKVCMSLRLVLDTSN